MKNGPNNEFARHSTAEPARQPVGAEAWHVLPVDVVKDRLQTDVAQGLTQAEAARRLAQYGPNTLAHAHQRSTLAIFMAQFRSLIVALLVAATVKIGRAHV